MNGNVYIGLDASTTKTGYAVFKNQKLIEYGLIVAKDSDWRNRIYEQSKQLDTLFTKYNPFKVYIEDVPLNAKGGIKVAVMLGAVQGMIYGIGASHNINMEFLMPNSWRSPLGLFDGTERGKLRVEMKRKAVDKANELFNLNLVYKGASSKFNQDDIADAILLCFSQIKNRAFGKK